MSTIFVISSAVPETINSTLFKFWNTSPLIDHEVGSLLSNDPPVRADKYSSQVNSIF